MNLMKNSAYKKMLIVGHTHRPKYPSNGEEPYFNTGSCIHPRKITGIELDNGKISLIEWRMRPDAEGSLYIVRRVMKGPEDVDRFMYDETSNV